MATKFADTLTALIRSRPQGITAQAIVVITARPRGTVASALRTLRIAGLIHRVGTVPSTRGGAPKVLYGVEPSLRARAFSPAPDLRAAIPPARPAPLPEPIATATAALETELEVLEPALATLEHQVLTTQARLGVVRTAIAALQALSPTPPGFLDQAFSPDKAEEVTAPVEAWWVPDRGHLWFCVEGYGEEDIAGAIRIDARRWESFPPNTNSAMPKRSGEWSTQSEARAAVEKAVRESGSWPAFTVGADR